MPAPCALRQLGTHCVDVWLISVEQQSSQLEHLERCIDADERARASRIRSEDGRHSYVLAHGALRQILAKYLPALPHELRFGRGEHGKPSLLPRDGWADLRFNLAHSRDSIVVAVAQGRDLGVDVEWIDADSPSLNVAKQFFSSRERQLLCEVPTELRLRAFYECWVRKEAFVKGIGAGLTMPLQSFDVSLGRDEPARLLGCRTDPTAPARWSLFTLKFSPDYAAALAIEASQVSFSINTLALELGR